MHVSNNKIKLSKKLKISAFYTKIRSLNKNFDELEEIIKDKNDNPTALCLPETWLPSDCLFNLYELSRYNMIILESTNKSNGVAIFVEEAVAYEIIQTPRNLCFTSLTIRNFKTRNVILCCIYN